MRPPTIVSIAFVPVLLAACSYNPATGRNQLLLLSTQEEIALGNEAKPALTEQYGGEIASSQLRAYVDGVGRGLAAQTEADYPQLPWEFIVLDSDVINAFALPGGKVFVSRGLLERLVNEAQLAGVLGHEIGHVAAQHVDERISQALLLQLGLSVAAGLSESQAVLYGARLFSGGYQLKFGRDQEIEADELGMKYMTAVMYDPKGMRQLLAVLAKASTGPRPPEILSTHPYPESRIKIVQRLLEGPYRYTQDSPDFHTYRGRFRREAAPYLVPAPQAHQGQAAPIRWCALCATPSHLF